MVVGGLGYVDAAALPRGPDAARQFLSFREFITVRTSRRNLLAVPAAVVLAGALGLTAVAPASAAVPAAPAAVAAQAAPATGATGHLDAKKAKPPFPGLTASQVLNKSRGAFKGAKSFRVVGFEVVQKVKYSFDIRVSQAQAQGAFTTPTGTQYARRLGNTVYWQYDEKSIASLKLSEELSGKWIKLTPGVGPEWELVTRTMSPASWSKLMAQVRVTSRKAGPKIGGVPTVRLIQPGAKGGSLYIAVTGPAFPLLLSTNDRRISYSFSLYNKPFTVDAPEGDSIVEADK